MVSGGGYIRVAQQCTFLLNICIHTEVSYSYFSVGDACVQLWYDLQYVSLSPTNQPNMPVCVTGRVRIGRFIQNPPDIDKQEMIQRFLERWKAKKETSKNAASQPSTQTPCRPETPTLCQSETPSCTPETNPVPHTTGRCSVVWSCITQVLFTLLTLMKTCFQWFRKPCTTLIFGQHDSPAETSLPSETKVRQSQAIFCDINTV